MNYLEIAGTVTGLVYLYLEYKASVWLWAAGIIMPAIYLGVYYQAGLYADFGISVYYILASIYGVACWLRGKGNDNDTKAITSFPKKLYAPIFLVIAVLMLLLGIILSWFTDSTVPWADAFTTSLSIVAMWMLARKYLEQWIMWIIADIACAILYIYKDLWFTGGLYALYAGIAVFGYLKWKRLMQ